MSAGDEGQRPIPSFREEDDSDLFSLKPYTTGESIPSIERIPPTKEEVRRKRLIRIAIIAASVLAAAIVLLIALWLIHRSRVASAMEEVSDTGRIAAIEHALSLLESDAGQVAESRRIRLRAMRQLAGGGDDASAEALQTALDHVPEDGYAARERAIAATYVALTDGHLDAAMEAASQVVARGADASEAAHARALAARAVGNLPLAHEASALSVSQRPAAPRHVALLAEITARMGDPDGALGYLDGLPAPARGPGTWLARARILDRRGGAEAEVAERAQTSLDHDEATPHERAWARVLLARVAAHQGDRMAAKDHLQAMTETAPKGDEAFLLTAIEVALRVGAHAQARGWAERLPSPLSTDAGRRAQVEAELALTEYDVRRAEAALRDAPPSPRTSLAQARFQDASDEPDRARALYREASADPALRVPALVHLAGLELDRGRAAEALSTLAPLLDAEGTPHPDIVPVAVRAQLAQNQAEAAQTLLRRSIQAHPRDTRLLAARATVEMAREDWAEALATAEQAVALEPDEPDLHALRGRAAARLERAPVAREAFERALALNATHPGALEGLLDLNLLEERVEEARAVMGRIDDAGHRSLAVERLRGRLLTMEVAGKAGLRLMRLALGRHRRDPSLTMSLGWLYMQAEQYGNAVRTFGRLIRGDDPPTDAVLARILGQVRMRASSPANSTLNALLEEHPFESFPAETQAFIEAIRGRVALAARSRPLALRQVERAFALDPGCREAHLLMVDLMADRDDADTTENLRAALSGPHPSSRPLAQIALRMEEVDDEACEMARRYRRASPEGQYARGIWRVERDCRQR